MIIKQIAVGNSNEGFIESKFTDGFNIILSDDNNRGKTVLIQSILYALGNQPPAFPYSFEYKKYIYIIQFEVENKEYWVCRKNNEFIINNNGTLFFAESISEFKHYWDKNICTLPKIKINNIERIVDPSLFVQLFFVGQDKKSTDNIQNKGFYRKDDFYNMVYEIVGLGSIKLNVEELEIAKKCLKNFKDERNTLIKSNNLLKSDKHSSEILSVVKDKIAFEEKIKQIDRIQEEISNLKKERNRCVNRRVSWEKTIKELNSLNRTIKTGELKCMDCNSTNISYKGTDKDSFSFDVSTREMRKTIINSIKEKISSYNEELEKYSLDIHHKQEILKKMLLEDDITLETLVAYKSDVIGVSEIEKQILDYDDKIKDLENKIKTTETAMDNKTKRQKQFLDAVVQKMNEFYNAIDETGNNEIKNIFTESGRIYSGSESTMFYLVKLYALAVILVHNFPIIIDSFRAEDLSSAKEIVALEWFSKLKNQLIFTTTIKTEEIGKYDKYREINVIDYTNHTPNKMLQENYVNNISKILTEIFKIEI